MRKRSIVPATFIALSLAASSLWTAPAAIARSSFDGRWSVLIVTDAGTCDRAYRYALNISNGRVSYDDPSFQRIRPCRRPRPCQRQRRRRRPARERHGELSGDSGRGLWRGNSSTSACSGHWEAERRG